MYTANARKAVPINRIAGRSRSSAVPLSCQTTTIEAPISIRESRAKPASATEPARVAAVATMITPTTFQPSVMYSSSRPLRSSWARCSAVLRLAFNIPRVDSNAAAVKTISTTGSSTPLSVWVPRITWMSGTRAGRWP